MVLQFTSADFDEKVLKPGQTVLVDFYADWCGPCKMMAPTVDAVAEALAGRITAGKLNVDENGDIAERYGVMSIPTLILFKDGKEAGRTVGLQSKDALLNFVKSV